MIRPFWGPDSLTKPPVKVCGFFSIISTSWWLNRTNPFEKNAQARQIGANFLPQIRGEKNEICELPPAKYMNQKKKIIICQEAGLFGSKGR